MGHTDDLEDFDAELEIQLKREYKTVFPLFRYCVITQEATYLCNELEMDCVPHSAYLLFEIDMKDVWVWDRNRPTRIIPRAHVYTTADVTVEQLREEPDADLGAALPMGVMDQLRAQIELDEDELPLLRQRELAPEDEGDAAAGGEEPAGEDAAGE
jgi:hypothetical protein